jgi:pSer/pThr/pTyr-binding forkhead associated (FHA) protein
MPHLSIYRKGRLEGVFSLPKTQVAIGRAEGVEIQLLDSRVSRRHAVIRESVAGYLIQDLNTRNGTFVNREAVEKSLLFAGDTIIIGSYTFQFLEGEIQDVPPELLSEVSMSGEMQAPASLGDRRQNPPRAKTDVGANPPVQRAVRMDRQPPPPGRDTSKTAIPLIEAMPDEE